jgi:hypothetical protein
LEVEIRRDDGIGHQATAGVGRRKPAAKKDVCGRFFAESGAQGFDRKKALVTAEKRNAVGYLKKGFELSERSACEAINLSRTVYRYDPLPSRDKEIGEALKNLASKHHEMGFGKFFTMLRREGKSWNHKRVHRIYCGLKLNKRQKHKRRLPTNAGQPILCRMRLKADEDSGHSIWSMILIARL